jgi:hypothetical protein
VGTRRTTLSQNNHPILAMLVLGLIALIGFVCIFELPIGWLPF